VFLIGDLVGGSERRARGDSRIETKSKYRNEDSEGRFETVEGRETLHSAVRSRRKFDLEPLDSGREALGGDRSSAEKADRVVVASDSPCPRFSTSAIVKHAKREKRISGSRSMSIESSTCRTWRTVLVLVPIRSCTLAVSDCRATLARSVRCRLSDVETRHS